MVYLEKAKIMPDMSETKAKNFSKCYLYHGY